MDPRRRMFRLAVIPERSAALITEGLLGDSPLADSRALAAFTAAEVSTAEVAEAFTVAEVTAAAVAGNSVQLPQTRLMIWRKNSCAQTI